MHTGIYPDMQAAFLDIATMGPTDLDTSPLSNLIPDIGFFDATSSEQVKSLLADVDCVFTNKIQLGETEFAAAPKLRFIGLTATCADNIDLAAAQRRGIAVANIRAYCTQSIVQHVFAGLLTLTQSLDGYRQSVAAGEWQETDIFCLLDHPIRELAGRNIGIVGYGELGKGVARLAECLGMHVLIAARPGSSSTAAELRVPFEDVLQQTDVLSLHCPLTANNHHLIGARQLARMKSDAILINTARGGLVDSAALVHALENQQIGGAAIDVLAKEPPGPEEPLLRCRHPRLILTPHVGWAARESRQRAIDELAANLKAFMNGERRNRLV